MKSLFKIANHPNNKQRVLFLKIMTWELLEALVSVVTLGYVVSPYFNEKKLDLLFGDED